MLDRGLSSSGLTVSQNKSAVVASLRAVRRELLEQGISFEGANSVRDVGLDANAEHKRSVRIQTKRERAEVSQKKRSYQSHTKRLEAQT